MEIKGIYSVTRILILILCKTALVASQCTLPDEVQGHWRINNNEGFQFSVTQQIRELLVDNTVQATYVCESFASLDPGYYFLRRLNTDPTQKQCIQIFVDGNLMVYWEKSNMPADTGGLNATDCLPDNRKYDAPPNILTKIGANAVCDIFMESLQGQYQVELDRSDTSVDLCANDDNSSATLEENTLELNTCEIADVRLSSASYQCMGEISSPEYIGALSISASAIILTRTVGGVTSFFCARTLASSAKIEMSVDFTARVDGQVICDKDQTHTSASDSGDIFIALTMIPKDCDFGACENGATCTQNVGSFECACADGFDGDTCEINMDDCDPNQCLNGATCTDGIANFTCECIDSGQFSGTLCEESDLCFSDPCQNSGTCNRMGNDSFVCDCPAGYTGNTCETNIDDCDPNLCENGATCTDLVDDYNCTCSANEEFFGDNCENRDPCFSDVCENGASCNRISNTDFTCTCPPDFTGEFCESPLMCNSEPCTNGGTCSEVDPGDDYTCACPPEFTGKECDVALYCEPTNPCENGGSCTEGSDIAVCSCVEGYTGETCDTELFCTTNNICINGATCEEPNDASSPVSCLCQPGFTGTNCDTELFCEPDSPCENGGTCLEDTDSCTCPQGWTGDTCETKLYCDPGPCENDATCVEGVDKAECTCSPFYTGEYCDTALFCVPDNCQSGSTCNEENRRCDCPPGFTGLLCDTELKCADEPCKNGGTCVEPTDSTDPATCTCPERFGGSTCEEDMSACASSPCVNGTCSGDLNSYTCSCIAGFTGTNCDEVSMESDDEFDWLPVIITLAVLGALIVIGLVIWCCCCLFRGSGSSAPVKTRPEFQPPPAFVPAPMITTAAPQPFILVDQPPSQTVLAVPKSNGPIVEEVSSGDYNTPARIYDEQFGSMTFG